jgi:hypothetical protein
MDPLMMDIDVTADGEYAQHGELKIVMTTEQADKLAEVLKHISVAGDFPEARVMIDMLVYAIDHRDDHQS